MGSVKFYQESDAVKKAYAECSKGKGGVVVLSGAVGGGKTTFLGGWKDVVRADGGIVLEATCARTESKLQLGVITQLVSSLKAQIPPSSGIALSLSTWTWTDDERYVSWQDEQAFLRELCTILMDVSRDRAVAILIDDANHADNPSLVALIYLARRLRSARTLVLISDGTSVRAEYQCFQNEMLREPHARHLRLRPFSGEDIAVLLAEHTEIAAVDHTAARTLQITGGNPLLVRCLLDDIRSRPAPDGDFQPGDIFSQGITMCLLRYSYEIQDVARAIAILGHELATVPWLAEILQINQAAVASALEMLQATGILDANGRHRHPAGRDAVLRSWTTAKRTAAHARAAKVLHDHGLPPEVVARHLIAGDRVEDSWAVPTLCEAGSQALNRNDAEFTVEALHTALIYCESELREDLRLQVKTQIIRTQWRFDPAHAAVHLTDLIPAALDGRLPLSDSVSLIPYLLWFGRPGEVRKLAGFVRAQETPEVPSEVADIAETWLDCMYPGMPESQPALRLSSPGSDRKTSVRPGRLTTKLLRRPEDVSVIAQAEQLRHQGWLDDERILSIATSILALIYTSRLDEATLWCSSLLADNDIMAVKSWKALLLALRSSIEAYRGQFPQAGASARIALALLSAEGWGAAIALPLANAILADAVTGCHDASDLQTNVSLPDGAMHTIGYVHYLFARGRRHLVLGLYHAALDDFMSCGSILARWGLTEVSIVPWAPYAAEVRLAMGDRDGARKFAEQELSGISPDRHACSRAGLLRVIALASDDGRRAYLLSEAVGIFERIGNKYELARTLADLARAVRATGEKHRALDAERRVSELAQQTGFVMTTSDGTAAEAGRAIAREPGSLHYDGFGRSNADSKLTNAELRVAELAARGHTNRQIAGKLYLTISTVEQHLTRAYRKLNIARRSELTQKLGGHGMLHHQRSVPSAR